MLIVKGALKACSAVWGGLAAWALPAVQAAGRDADSQGQRRDTSSCACPLATL